MSFRFLADENFNADAVWGLLRRVPHVDIVFARDVGLGARTDPEVLAWASDNARIVITHDAKTMPKFAYDRLTSGLAMPGLFVIAAETPVGTAIDALVLLTTCSQPEEWDGLVTFLPL